MNFRYTAGFGIRVDYHRSANYWQVVLRKRVYTIRKCDMVRRHADDLAGDGTDANLYTFSWLVAQQPAAHRFAEYANR